MQTAPTTNFPHINSQCEYNPVHDAIWTLPIPHGDGPVIQQPYSKLEE